MKQNQSTSHLTLIFTLLATSLLLTACGDSGDTDDTVVLPDNGTSFFNADAKFKFADSMLSNFLGFARSAEALIAETKKKRTIAAVESETLDCDAGSVSFSMITDDVTTEPTAASFDFNNCRQGIETTNGSIAISGEFDESAENGSATLSATNFTVTGGTEPLGLNGSVTIAAQDDGVNLNASISGTTLSMTSGNETITFSDYSVTLKDSESTGVSSLGAALTVQSSIDGTITINIDPALTGTSDSEYPEAGRIVMQHSDGSSLTINADNGDPNTFDYSINENGSISSGVSSWSETELADL